MSSNIIVGNTETGTTTVFKIQYPPSSLKHPKQFSQDILAHNQNTIIMNAQEREAFHITLTFLVGLAFLLVAAVVIYFLISRLLLVVRS